MNNNSTNQNNTNGSNNKQQFDSDTTSNQIALSPSTSSQTNLNNTNLIGNNNNNLNSNNTINSTNSISVTNNSIINNNLNSNNNLNNNSVASAIPECKVWKNPMSLFRGAEYSKLTLSNGKEPLTFYDMNLSAQDHQTFFTCESDDGKPEYEIMQRAWRERNPSTRVSLANEALNKSPEYIYLRHLKAI